MLEFVAETAREVGLEDTASSSTSARRRTDDFPPAPAHPRRPDARLARMSLIARIEDELRPPGAIGRSAAMR